MIDDYPRREALVSTLLIVDDEPNVRFSLEHSLRSDALQVKLAETGRQGIEAVRTSTPDAVLMDVRLPDMSGLDAFDEIHKIHPGLPVIVITAHGTTDTAIEAMKRGAFDYLLKPFELPQLRTVVARALELSRLGRDAVEDGAVEAGDAAADLDLIVGRSLAMQEVYKAIGRVATSEVNVLVHGESGTGKELVARSIYHHSRRSQQPFVAINCAAIPEPLLESELFGHERGAFTGADRRRIGKFEQAHGGTLFLDEIGDMSGATQAKVLRLLQDQRFERVGGNETIQTDVRVIAATNQDLEELVTAGRFRRDLYYRLKVYTIELPPLRQRLEDLPLLVEHFIKLFNAETGKQVRVASETTTQLLASYFWPGNVRELQGVIKNAMVNTVGEVLTPECLPPNIRAGAELARQLDASDGPGLSVAGLVQRLLESGDDDIYRKVVAAIDRVVVGEVLRAVDENQVEASRRLGISRTTLRAKLQNLNATGTAAGDTP
jgi:two-component system nitrogen regulation response regulator GlnG